jgi:hypothetical protein
VSLPRDYSPYGNFLLRYSKTPKQRLINTLRREGSIPAMMQIQLN